MVVLMFIVLQQHTAINIYDLCLLRSASKNYDKELEMYVGELRVLAQHG